MKAEVGLAKLTSINNESCCISRCLCVVGVESVLGSCLPFSRSVVQTFMSTVNVGTILAVTKILCVSLKTKEWYNWW
jgi:hypothetical protein